MDKIDGELIDAARQWCRPFPPVVEGERVFISPNFYLERDENGLIVKKRREVKE